MFLNRKPRRLCDECNGKIDKWDTVYLRKYLFICEKCYKNKTK